MQTIQELGAAIAQRRRSLGLKQGHVAATAGLAQAALSRFERGKLPEFGSRKLSALKEVSDLDHVGAAFYDCTPIGRAALDELQRTK